MKLPKVMHGLVFLAAVSAAVAGERFRFERPLMGTRFTVVCYANDREAASKAADLAFGEAERINRAASDYRTDAELVLLPSHSIGAAVPVSPTLFALLEHSRHIAELSGGAFDPTLGPLTKLWRETRDSGCLPGAEKLDAARAACGWRHFSVDHRSRGIMFHREPMAFDLGGVAKGYAADLMLDSLKAAGISRVMIAAGGDIRVGDPPPGRDGWRVAIQTFDPARPDEVLTLANAAVSTSGDLHQSVEIHGVRYSHILDPVTGLGLTRRIAASVIADEAKLSDPLATAACVLGPDRIDALRKLPGVREVKIRTLQEPSSNRRSGPDHHEKQP